MSWEVSMRDRRESKGILDSDLDWRWFKLSPMGAAPNDPDIILEGAHTGQTRMRPRPARRWTRRRLVGECASASRGRWGCVGLALTVTGKTAGLARTRGPTARARCGGQTGVCAGRGREEEKIGGDG